MWHSFFVTLYVAFTIQLESNPDHVKAQVREISRDVDSIMVDVETLHRLEQDLKKKPAKPALFPKPKLYKANSSTIANNGMFICLNSRVVIIQ